MKPKIFSEQIDRLDSVDFSPISFRDYKIDYSQYLGSGAYGRVYALVPRPDNEKSFLSAWFPYLYDRIFPITGKCPNNYCVKISKSFVEVAFQEIKKDNNYALQVAFDSLLEKNIDHVGSSLRNRYGLSAINVHSTNSRYALIKSQVVGKTFYDCMKTSELIDPKNYLMRKSFVDFLWAIGSMPLCFGDTHAKNVMYDSKNHRWEIVDGSTKEDIYPTPNLRASKIEGIICHLLGSLSSSNTKQRESLTTLITILRDCAINNVSYSKRIDEKSIFQAIPVTNDAEFHSSKTLKYSDICKNGKQAKNALDLLKNRGATSICKTAKGEFHFFKTAAFKNLPNSKLQKNTAIRVTCN